MDSEFRTALWKQFGAAIAMLENDMRACPDGLWSDRSQQPEFWAVAYHTLFWLDLYLYGATEGFAPPAPFGLDELDADGQPPRTYGKTELLSYLEHGRVKCREAIEALTDESANRRCRFRWGEVSFFELLLYNLRHVQDHAGELSLMLGQKTGSAPKWVTRAKGERDGE